MALILTIARYNHAIGANCGIQSPFYFEMHFCYRWVSATKLFFTGVFSVFSSLFTAPELIPLESLKPV